MHVLSDQYFVSFVFLLLVFFLWVNFMIQAILSDSYNWFFNFVLLHHCPRLGGHLRGCKHVKSLHILYEPVPSEEPVIKWLMLGAVYHEHFHL